MSWIGIVLRLIPTIIKLVSIAEKACDDVPDSGAEKKQMVTEGIKALIGGLSGVTFTPELWAKITTVIDPLIDIAASFLFPHEETK